jgi:hypothetical protein
MPSHRAWDWPYARFRAVRLIRVTAMKKSSRTPTSNQFDFNH